MITDLEELKEIVQKRTPGKWSVSKGIDGYIVEAPPKPAVGGAVIVCQVVALAKRYEDAVLIALIPGMLEIVLGFQAEEKRNG